MTKTTELAEKYAQANYNEWVGDNYWQVENDYNDIKDAYRNGAQDMLERACARLRQYITGVRGEEFINEFRKAMEE